MSLLLTPWLPRPLFCWTQLWLSQAKRPTLRRWPWVSSWQEAQRFFSRIDIGPSSHWPFWGPQNTPANYTGSFTLPLEGPRSLGWNLIWKSTDNIVTMWQCTDRLSIHDMIKFYDLCRLLNLNTRSSLHAFKTKHKHQGLSGLYRWRNRLKLVLLGATCAPWEDPSCIVNLHRATVTRYQCCCGSPCCRSSPWEWLMDMEIIVSWGEQLLNPFAQLGKHGKLAWEEQISAAQHAVVQEQIIVTRRMSTLPNVSRNCIVQRTTRAGHVPSFHHVRIYMYNVGFGPKRVDAIARAPMLIIWSLLAKGLANDASELRELREWMAVNGRFVWPARFGVFEVSPLWSSLGTAAVTARHAGAKPQQKKHPASRGVTVRTVGLGFFELEGWVDSPAEFFWMDCNYNIIVNDL